MNTPDSDLDDPLGFFTGLRNALIISMSIIGLCIGAGYALSPADEADVTAKIEHAARDKKAVRPEVCIHQYGPGERWISSSRTSPPSCSSPARAVPAHVLSQPVEQ